MWNCYHGACWVTVTGWESRREEKSNVELLSRCMLGVSRGMGI